MGIEDTARDLQSGRGGKAESPAGVSLPTRVKPPGPYQPCKRLGMLYTEGAADPLVVFLAAPVVGFVEGGPSLWGTFQPSFPGLRSQPEVATKQRAAWALRPPLAAGKTSELFQEAATKTHGCRKHRFEPTLGGRGKGICLSAAN